MPFRMIQRAAAPLLALALALPSFAQAGVVATAGGYEVSYGADVHTLYGSPITSVVILESDGTQFNIDTSFGPIANGVFALSHVIPFQPTSALVFGIDLSPTGARPHLVTFEDPDFVQTILGRRFDAAFGLSENIFLAAVPAAAAGDAAAQQTLISFFTGPGAGAAFNPAGRFLVVEHSIPVIASPEPATLAIFGAALAGMVGARRRRR